MSPTPEPRTGGRRAGELARFFRLANGYWHGESRWPAIGLAVATFTAGLLQVLLQLRLNLWLGDFFDALEAHHRPRILEQAIAFAILVAAIMAAGAWLIHARMSWQIGLRQWLASTLIARWMESGRHYVLRLHDQRQDDVDYRIAEDARLVTEASIDFAVGLMNSLLALAGFIGVLWSLSGSFGFEVAGLRIAIPGNLVLIAIAYAGFGSAITYLVGRPMTAINENRHAREGEFRAQLQRAAENSEAIAFLHGERDERRGLELVLERLLRSWRDLAGRQRRLTLVTVGYTTMAPVVPLIAGIPSFLAGEITIGGLVQASAAFVQIQLALGFFVDNFARIADWRAGVNRLLALADALDGIDRRYRAAGPGTIEIAASRDGVIRFVDVRLDEPDGVVVIEQASVEIRPGERVLVIGESGSGKTTLVRAVAGLWPWGSGRIELPRETRIAFMPERPYFPPGRLRDAIAYPDPPETYSAEQIAAALERCGLAAFVARLDESAPWERTLSVGEQQRLGFVRQLLHRPGCVFMDEATTALDAEALADVMTALRESLASATLVSVDHRPGLDAFHDRSLSLAKTPGGGRIVDDDLAADAMRNARGGRLARAMQVLRRRRRDGPEH